MPVVSVIMPVFNGERFLREAIESILTQSYSDFEFIIVDDGSTDATAGIIGSFTDQRIKALRNERNLGITESLNRGMNSAGGIFVCRMDADDIALPERIRKQIEFFEHHPEVVLLGTGTILIDGTGREIGRERHPGTQREIMRTIFIHNPFAHGTVMIRSEILKECGPYDKRFLHNEDYALWLRVASRYSSANLEEPLLKRRVHQTNITVTKETQLVRYRIRTLAHAIFGYYHKPHYAVFLIRPIAAYLFRLVKGTVQS